MCGVGRYRDLPGKPQQTLHTSTLLLRLCPSLSNHRKPIHTSTMVFFDSSPSSPGYNNGNGMASPHSAGPVSPPSSSSHYNQQQPQQHQYNHSNHQLDYRRPVSPSYYQQQHAMEQQQLQQQAQQQAMEQQDTGYLCRDEREGLSNIMSCSMLSPTSFFRRQQQGGGQRFFDERADVLSDDEEYVTTNDLVDSSFGVGKSKSRDETDNLSRSSRTSRVTSPTSNMKRAASPAIMTINSCLSGDCADNVDDNAAALKNTNSLVDDILSDTDGDTVEEGGTKGITSSPKTVNFAPSTNQEDDGTLGDATLDETLDGERTYNTYDEDTFSPENEVSARGKKKNKKSLLSQAISRASKPHAGKEIVIPDDDSEASMMALMRYMGCTPQAYGEGPGGRSKDEDMPSGKEFVFEGHDDDDDDDGSTLSGDGTFASYAKSTWTMDAEEEEDAEGGDRGGIELGIDEFVASGKGSVSMDDSTKKEGMKMEVEMSGDGKVRSKPELTVDTNESVAAATRRGNSNEEENSQASTVYLSFEESKSLKEDDKVTETVTKVNSTDKNPSSSSISNGNLPTSPVKDIIQDFLASPKEKWDKESLISTLSASALRSPSVKKLLESNLVSPRSTNPVVFSKRAGASPAASAKAALSPINAHDALSPSNMSITGRKDALSPIMSALSPSSTYDALSPSNVKFNNLKLSSTGETTDTNALLDWAQKQQQREKGTSQPAVVESEDSENSANSENSAVKVVAAKAFESVAEVVDPAAASLSLSSSTEESSSFDKNDATKGKEFVLPQAANLVNMAADESESTLCRDDASEARSTASQPVSPTKKSVRQVDDLLNKSRVWLSRHSETQKSRLSLVPIEESSILARTRAGTVQFKERRKVGEIGANVTLPTSQGDIVSVSSDVSALSRKSIMEELAELKAKQHQRKVASGSTKVKP